MADAHHMDEATYQAQVKAVWTVTIWLTIITILEVGFALGYMFMPGINESVPRWVLNLTFIIASLGKAFFIIGEFMHLKYEKRVLMISLAVPLIFLVWAIIAFMWEADAWYHMRGF
jgi:cytochrome c oxidase subunit IV